MAMESREQVRPVWASIQRGETVFDVEYSVQDEKAQEEEEKRRTGKKKITQNKQKKKVIAFSEPFRAQQCALETWRML